MMTISASRTELGSQSECAGTYGPQVRHERLAESEFENKYLGLIVVTPLVLGAIFICALMPDSLFGYLRTLI